MLFLWHNILYKFLLTSHFNFCILLFTQRTKAAIVTSRKEEISKVFPDFNTQPATKENHHLGKPARDANLVWDVLIRAA